MISTTHAARPKRSPWEIQRAVLFALVVREFRTRMGRHWTGVAWTVFEPLAHVVFIVTMFGFLRAVSSPTMEFPVFLVSGMLPFFLFRDLAGRLTEAIDNNRALFSYRQVKPFDAVVGRGIVEVLIWLAVFIAMLILLEWAGYHALPQRPLELALIIAVIVFLGGGLGLLVAVSTHQRPRARKVVGFIYFPLYFISGAIFSIDKVPRSYQDWLLWNPLLHLVALARAAFEPRQRSIQGIGLGYPLAFTLVLLALALALYRRDRQKLMQGG